MTIAVHTVAFLALVGAAMLAGAQLFVSMAVIPALPEWPRDMSVRVHQGALSWRPHRYLRVFGGGTVATTLVLFIASVIAAEGVVSEILIGAALVCAVVSTYLSTREWPINHEIDSWGEKPDLERYPALRSQWDAQHRMRTVLSIVVLCLLAAGVVTLTK